MYSQEQLMGKGIEIGHWPTFERHPEIRDNKPTGDVIGMIYDTTSWPVPDEVYHPDNRRKWYCNDSNRPAHTPEQIEAMKNNILAHRKNRRELSLRHNYDESV